MGAMKGGCSLDAGCVNGDEGGPPRCPMSVVVVNFAELCDMEEGIAGVVLE